MTIFPSTAPTEIKRTKISDNTAEEIAEFLCYVQ